MGFGNGMMVGWGSGYGMRTPLSSNQSATGHSLSIINERYARGEISTNEYINLKKDIFN